MESCPRCSDTFDSRYPALSRADNKTYICSDCGLDEAFCDFFEHRLTNPVDWPVERKYTFVMAEEIENAPSAS